MNDARRPLVNIGHGHVYPRADGALARCGGPALCPECARDKVRFDAEIKAAVAFITDTKFGGE